MSCTRAALAILILFGHAGVFAQTERPRDAQATPPQNLVEIDASQPSAPPETVPLHKHPTKRSLMQPQNGNSNWRKPYLRGSAISG
jgi:hypothetical protein